jgi:hypothetical protein
MQWSIGVASLGFFAAVLGDTPLPTTSSATSTTTTTTTTTTNAIKSSASSSSLHGALMHALTHDATVRPIRQFWSRFRFLFHSKSNRIANFAVAWCTDRYHSYRTSSDRGTTFSHFCFFQYFDLYYAFYSTRCHVACCYLCVHYDDSD